MVHIKERRVTQKDIAQAADLSIAAVSMALKGNQALPQATINRVRQIAKQLGYVPDPALSALAAHRNLTRTRNTYSVLAFINQGEKGSSWESLPSSQMFLQGAKQRAQELGYSLQNFGGQSENLSPSRLNQILKTRGIKGIILSPQVDALSQYDFAWEDFTTVSILQDQPFSSLQYITHNQHSDMTLCWKKLLERGHRRIALALDEKSTHENNAQWEASHLFAQRNFGIENYDCIPAHYCSNETSPEATKRWFNTIRPTAILSNRPHFLDALGFPVTSATTQNFDYVSLNTADDRPGVSGLRRQSETIGSLAIDALNTLLQRNQSGAASTSIGTLVGSDWVDGNTLR